MKDFVLLLILLTGGIQLSTTALASSGEIAHGSLVIPNRGAYIGAYIDFGATEDKVTLEGIEKYEKMVGKPQAIIASSSFWGELTFPSKNIQLILRHGALPLIYWSPWDRPYVQEKGPDRFSLDEILLGKWDAYIDQWATAAKDIGQPLMVSWGLEMNGNWFPWSGCFYGGESLGKSGLNGPDTYKKAYRYVVDRVRARGAMNIIWVFHISHFTDPPEPWNQIAEYYPGPEYVDWLGLSYYGKQFNDEPWSVFDSEAIEIYQALCALDPEKPILLAEFGVGEFPAEGSKADWLANALNAIKTRFIRIKAAVYWHERWLNDDGTYSNLRIHSSPEALNAYRAGLADVFWLSRPQYLPKKIELPLSRPQ